MIKKLAISFLCLFSMATFACPNALPTNDANFCPSFKTAATCYCTASGFPSGMCQDTNALYNRMLTVFKSLQKACEFQHYTSTQDCLDNWSCYLAGGIDSQGRSCSGTQHSCV